MSGFSRFSGPRPTYRRGMGRDSDRRVYWFAATALLVVVGLVAAFLWYLDSVGTSEAPGEGRAPADQGVEASAPL